MYNIEAVIKQAFDQGVKDGKGRKPMDIEKVAKATTGIDYVRGYEKGCKDFVKGYQSVSTKNN
tara:strand:- start:50 stop:238 length:189 start_codon:yes stop_codon:yes gene_type:complete